MKLNTLLAKTEHLGVQFKKIIGDYVNFFKNNQGDFRGEKKTYDPNPGTMDEPSLRGNRLVVTTVDEKLDYLVATTSEYIDSLFSQERTNSMGIAKAELIVDGNNFGEFTSMELLRLKSLIENNVLETMYLTIPVRDDKEIWKTVTDEEYKGRNIFESTLQEGSKRTTVKESYIVVDPNLTKETSSRYTPILAEKNSVMELGKYTLQKYSGEYTHRERAEILGRRTKMLTAVIEALKVANDVETVQSSMTAQKIFSYLHKGSL